MQEIQALKIEIDDQKARTEKVIESIGKMADDIGKFADAMREQTTTLAVYIEKHDYTQKEIQALKATCKEQQKQIDTNTTNVAVISPTVESMRGMVWKIITAIFLSMGGAVAVISSVAQ